MAKVDKVKELEHSRRPTHRAIVNLNNDLLLMKLPTPRPCGKKIHL